MIRRVLPGDVVVVTSGDLDLSDDDAVAALHPAEAALVEKASPGRRAEFAVARACAREGLRRLGRPVVPVLRGGRGSPLWPPLVVGTLSHCPGLRVAALADAGAVRSVGLDVEPHGPLPAGVLRSVALPSEVEWVDAAPTDAGLHRDRLLFTAKEAVYKAWFPLTRRWLGFEDAELSFTVDGPAGDHGDSHDDGRATGPDAGTTVGGFTARILVDGGVVDGGPTLRVLRGRWAADGEFVTSAVVVRPGQDTATGAGDPQPADTVGG